MKKPFALGALLGALALLPPVSRAQDAAPKPLRAGDVLFQTDFSQPDALAAWRGVPANKNQVRIEDGALLMEAPAGGTRNIKIDIPVPVASLRGARVRCEARVRAQDVAPPPKPYNGIKVMLHHVSPGGSHWDQQNNVSGTFAWKKVSFVTDVPADSSEASLVLGLEETTGRAWFDDLKITLLAAPRLRPAKRPSGPMYKGHSLERLRGTMVSPNIQASDLQVLAGWRANHIRWQLLWNGFPHSPADNGDMAAYDAWLESALKHLDEMLPVCRKLGLLVLIDLHTPPGGRNDANEMGLFREKRFQDSFVRIWDKIARRYKGNPAVWGYDLVNEPVEGTIAEGLLDWRDLAIAAARRVRAVDAERAIIVEPAQWGAPSALEHFDPLPITNVVYSVHFYEPHAFTHQGVHNNPSGFSYPGEISGKTWSKDTMRAALRPVIEWQCDTNAHIYIGEFSAIRWAPNGSAAKYLSDAIDVFEENGWDWDYHAFREWNGWSVEHGSDPKDDQRSKTPTDREMLLRSWFAKNQLPNQTPAAQK